MKRPLSGKIAIASIILYFPLLVIMQSCKNKQDNVSTNSNIELVDYRMINNSLVSVIKYNGHTYLRGSTTAPLVHDEACAALKHIR